ncbi:MAG: bifunctional 5,10-methylene-tetrahydrofolate dehydrogenase/5,10-methylene-tetrahydrofolate cyclohydrolase [Oscillospiraceae bacterium]|nr:bifunctional 5,10-methylene-tetrahydrofolate dehydrogenase/5,10-methylene-tetrahydrofolate cyclohydrolase [Oscillospiraceae bacterium]
MANVWSGAAVAAALREEYKNEAAALLKETGIVPGLAILRIGDVAEAKAYEAGIYALGEATGVKVSTVVLSEGVEEAGVIEAIEKLNKDESIHGVITMRPFPANVRESAVAAALDPAKDVDGMTPGSLTGIFTGTHVGFAPCTSDACVKILEHYGVALAGKRAAVLGRSMTVGKPAAMLLLEKNATVTLCHSKSEDLAAVCREAEILVVGIGKANAIGRDHIREGAYVVDAGISVIDGAFVGDVEEAAAAEKAAAYAPVMDGVGAVTVSLLMGHTVEAARRSGK